MISKDLIEPSVQIKCFCENKFFVFETILHVMCKFFAKPFVPCMLNVLYISEILSDILQNMYSYSRIYIQSISLVQCPKFWAHAKTFKDFICKKLCVMPKLYSIIQSHSWCNNVKPHQCSTMEFPYSHKCMARLMLIKYNMVCNIFLSPSPYHIVNIYGCH